jgi:hypothetical protein
MTKSLASALRRLAEKGLIERKGRRIRLLPRDDGPA